MPILTGVNAQHEPVAKYAPPHVKQTLPAFRPGWADWRCAYSPTVYGWEKAVLPSDDALTTFREKTSKELMFPS